VALSYCFKTKIKNAKARLLKITSDLFSLGCELFSRTRKNLGIASFGNRGERLDRLERLEARVELGQSTARKQGGAAQQARP
jgi:hypothetical protein